MIVSKHLHFLISCCVVFLLVSNISNAMAQTDTADVKKESNSDATPVFNRSSKDLKLAYNSTPESPLKSQYKKVLSAREVRDFGIGITAIGLGGATISLISAAVSAKQKSCEDDSMGCFGEGLENTIIAAGFAGLALIGGTFWTIGGVRNIQRSRDLDTMLATQSAHRPIHFTGISPYGGKNNSHGLIATFSF